MSTQLLRSVMRLTARELLGATTRLVAHETEATAELVAHIAEVDRRRLYFATGCSSSIFGYCTRVLHLSEYAAYTRIQAARACRRFPVILERLSAGSLNLTSVGLLAPHLTSENCLELLEAAKHRSKRQVEQLIACIRPVEEIPPPSIRKLPGWRPFAAPAGGYATPPRAALPAPPAAGAPAMRESGTGSALAGTVVPISMPGVTVPGSATTGAAANLPAAVAPGAVISGPPSANESTTLAQRAWPGERSPAHRPVIVPLTPDRYRIQFTAGAGTYLKLRRAQDLLRHQVPDGSPAVILDRALTSLLVDIARKKFAELSRPPATGERGPSTRPGRGSSAGERSRYIPAGVRRRVWLRDGGQCTYVSPDGHRCPEHGWLEFHHVHPHAWGGPATADNIRLRCRAHNQYEARLIFKDRADQSG